MEKERSASRKFRGEDGDAGFLEDVEEALQEAREMLKEAIEDPDRITDVEAIVIPDPESDVLLELSYDFTMQAHNFLKEIAPLVNKDTKEYFEDIQWHHTVVSAKIYRAVSPDSESLADDEIRHVSREDAVNSAAVAIKSLTICIMSFDYIASQYPESLCTAQQCKELSAFAAKIKKQIKERFIESRFD
jgi:hypothetical protein